MCISPKVYQRLPSPPPPPNPLRLKFVHETRRALRDANLQCCREKIDRGLMQFVFARRDYAAALEFSRPTRGGIYRRFTSIHAQRYREFARVTPVRRSFKRPSTLARALARNVVNGYREPVSFVVETRLTSGAFTLPCVRSSPRRTGAIIHEGTSARARALERDAPEGPRARNSPVGTRGKGLSLSLQDQTAGSDNAKLNKLHLSEGIARISR